MVKRLKKISIVLLIFFIFFVGLSSIQAQEGNYTNNDDASNMENSTAKPYTDLYIKINSSEEYSTIELNESYRFDSNIDNDSFIDGISISKNITLVGKNNTFIDGNFLASGLNVASNCNVILKNITFINGYSETSAGAVLVGKNSNLLVDNCTFYNNKVHNSNGGAIYGLDGTNIEIRNSQFDNNVACRNTTLSWNAFKCGMGSAICMRIGSNLKLYDSVFKNNDGYVTTILIITWDDVNTNQSTLYVDNCLFENNTAWSNGAIYLDEFGIAEIKNSVFRKNNSTNLGGTIVFDASRKAIVKNCTFENNSAVYGGGIYSNTFDKKYDSNVEIYDSIFTNNAAKDGGGIFSKYSNMIVSNCKLNNNLASLNGGGMYFNVGHVNITDSQFIDNSAQYGGGLLLNANESSIVNSFFVKNWAFINGGAIYAARNSVNISCSKFIENSARQGGGIFFKSNEILVMDSLFEKNVASESGGAIYSNGRLLKVVDSHFSRNSARYGGGLLIKTAKNIVVNSLFVQNVAFNKGGAIYSKIDGILTSGCSYIKNSATKASDVYGVYHAKVTKHVAKSGYIKLKIVLTSTWKLSVSKNIKIKLNGYSSKWLKTNSKGVLTFTVPKNKKVTKNSLVITMDEGQCIIQNYVYKNPGKINVAKTVKKSSRLKVTIKNSQTKKWIKKTKFTIKIFTGKKYKKFVVKTNSKGFFNIKMAKFSKGNHKISVYLNNNEYYINKLISFKIK